MPCCAVTKGGSHLSLSCPHQEPGQLPPLPCLPGPQVGTKPYSDWAWLSDAAFAQNTVAMQNAATSTDSDAMLHADRGQACLPCWWSSSSSMGDPMQLTVALQGMAVGHHHAQLPGPSGIPGGCPWGCLRPQEDCAPLWASEGCSLASPPQPVGARHTSGHTLGAWRAMWRHQAKRTASRPSSPAQWRCSGRQNVLEDCGWTGCPKTLSLPAPGWTLKRSLTWDHQNLPLRGMICDDARCLLPISVLCRLLALLFALAGLSLAVGPAAASMCLAARLCRCELSSRAP